MSLSPKLEELLLEYSAGSLSETPSLLVATHLALSPPSRRLVREMDEIAGAVFSLEDVECGQSVPLNPELLSRSVTEYSDDGRDRHASSSPRTGIPEPLASYVGGSALEIQWRRKIPGLKEFALPDLSDGCEARLYRIRSGRSMPKHTHEGEELTLVIEGGFSDQTGSYRAGDVALADNSIEHRPIADPDGDCVCLAVTQGPLRLTGPIGRVLGALPSLK